MKLYLLFFILLGTNFLFGQKQFELYFDFNKDIPTQKSISDFNDLIATKPNLEITSIAGFCDSIDAAFYNKELAQRRINSVINIAKAKSISISKNIKINAIGEDFKQSKNQSENRKVTFEYIESSSSNIKVLITDLDTITSSKNKIEIERKSLEEKFKKAKVGDRIAIYNIHFKFNSENVETISEPLLEEMLYIMEQNPKMVIKIHGHICCNPNPYNTKLSYRRALQLFNYLRENGIQQNRLAYNGVGSNNPIYPIPEKNEEERIANRRVEIEIIRK